MHTHTGRDGIVKMDERFPDASLWPTRTLTTRCRCNRWARSSYGRLWWLFRSHEHERGWIVSKRTEQGVQHVHGCTQTPTLGERENYAVPCDSKLAAARARARMRLNACTVCAVDIWKVWATSPLANNDSDRPTASGVECVWNFCLISACCQCRGMYGGKWGEKRERTVEYRCRRQPNMVRPLWLTGGFYGLLSLAIVYVPLPLSTPHDPCETKPEWGKPSSYSFPCDLVASRRIKIRRSAHASVTAKVAVLLVYRQIVPAYPNPYAPHY